MPLEHRSNSDAPNVARHSLERNMSGRRVITMTYPAPHPVTMYAMNDVPKPCEIHGTIIVYLACANLCRIRCDDGTIITRRLHDTIKSEYYCTIA